MIVKGGFRSRQGLRNFCAEVIGQLRDSQVPVLLAINIPQTEPLLINTSPVDVIKYLIKQALGDKLHSHTEKSMSLSCARFQGCLAEEDWFQQFESTLADIG